MASERQMTPAERVISKCGGPKRVAEVLKIDVSNVHRWKYERGRDRAGLVPSHYAQELLAWAASQDIDLSPDDFFEVAPAAADASEAAQ